MTILKNELVYPLKEGDYCKPHHIIVEGTNEEIGFDLATLAKSQYGTSLLTYQDPVYGAARREMLERNWPAFAERSKGIRRAFGLDDDDAHHDSSSLVYDLYSVKGKSDAATAPKASCCSGLLMPIEKSKDGKSAYIGRNFDGFPRVLWHDLFGEEKPKGSFGYNERCVIMELRPTTGYKSILMGGFDLLTPVGDGMNDQGLYYCVFCDPNGVEEVGGHTAGDRINGVTMLQLGPFIISKCATVEEAKKEILANRITQVGLGIHMLFADKDGNGFIVEIDKATQSYIFIDRKPGEPLFVTNFPVSSYPTPESYPKYDEEAEHNPFKRMEMLKGAYAKMKAPFEEEDAGKLIDVVHCSFVDHIKADCWIQERTLININVDLSKLEVGIRFYLGDVKPIPGTNLMEDRMSERYTFGFSK